MQGIKTSTVCLALLAAAPALWGQPPAQERPMPIPDRVLPVIAGREAPEWVSAGMATRAGELRRNLFAPEELPILELSLESGRKARSRYLSASPDERPADPCAYVATSDHRIPPPARTLSGLVESSTGIYLGTVVAGRPGLLRGIPRALLRVKVERALKHEVPGPRPGSLLVAYPEVKLDVAGVCLAAKSPRHPERPEVGKRILVFTAAKIPLSQDAILNPEDEEVFFELEDGRASLAAHMHELLSPNGPLDLELVVEQTEEALEIPSPD